MVSKPRFSCERLEGRPATASPHAGPTTHGQGTLQGGGWLRPGLARKGGQRRPQGATPTGRSATCWHSHLQRDACNGGRLLGARNGLLPAANTAVSRGGDASRKGGRPLTGRLPAGKGSRRVRRGSDGDGVEGERGVRASFGEKNDPAPMNSKN
ncbi:hypothetical protein BHM03_00022256 [Ensete ventricosum]|nr:hypothetical protein BHM03_00022256 [Ensete ventricosum]